MIPVSIRPDWAHLQFPSPWLTFIRSMGFRRLKSWSGPTEVGNFSSQLRIISIYNGGDLSNTNETHHRRQWLEHYYGSYNVFCLWNISSQVRIFCSTRGNQSWTFLHTSALGILVWPLLPFSRGLFYHIGSIHTTECRSTCATPGQRELPLSRFWSTCHLCALNQTRLERVPSKVRRQSDRNSMDSITALYSLIAPNEVAPGSLVPNSLEHGADDDRTKWINENCTGTFHPVDSVAMMHRDLGRKRPHIMLETCPLRIVYVLSMPV